MVARVQDNGLARITSLLSLANWYFQWGTGSGAAKTANAVTTTGTTEPRTLATPSQTTVTVTNDTLQLVGTITAAASKAVTEVGVFDAAGSGSPPTGGNMDEYGDFASIALQAGDSITFTAKTTFM